MLDIVQELAGQLDETSIMPKPQPVGNDYPPCPAALLRADTRIGILQCRDPSLGRRADICTRHDVQFGTPTLRRALPYLQSRPAAAVGPRSVRVHLLLHESDMKVAGIDYDQTEVGHSGSPIPLLP